MARVIIKIHTLEELLALKALVKKALLRQAMRLADSKKEEK